MSSCIDDQSPVSKYYQLKELLKDKIKNGNWQPRSQIMSENEICAIYGVSRVTARKAVEELAREGYVHRVQGKGTFVNDKVIEQSLNHFYSFRQALRENGVEMAAQICDFGVVAADAELAEYLQISVDDQVFRIERLFLAEGVPYAKEISYIPCEVCRELTRAQVETFGLYDTLKHHGVYPTLARERIKAVNLSKEESEQMQLNTKDACIFLLRTTYCKGKVIELNKSIVRGDTFIYSVELKNGTL